MKALIFEALRAYVEELDELTVRVKSVRVEVVTTLKLLLTSKVRLAPRSLLPSVKVMSPPVLVKLDVPLTVKDPA